MEGGPHKAQTAQPNQDRYEPIIIYIIQEEKTIKYFISQPQKENIIKRNAIPCPPQNVSQPYDIILTYFIRCNYFYRPWK